MESRDTERINIEKEVNDLKDRQLELVHKLDQVHLSMKIILFSL